MMIATSARMVQKKCALHTVQVPKSYVWPQSSFFVKQKRLLNEGPSSLGSQMQLQSGFLLWNSPGANSISQPQQENIPEHLDGSKQRAEFGAIDLLPPH